MSRRPVSTSTRTSGIPRVASTASIAMPPPNRIPNRPPSAAAAATVNGNGNANGTKDGDASRPSSPTVRKTSARRNGAAAGATGVKSAPGGGIEVGETNIQVVVRCRGRSSQELAASSPVITTTDGALAKAITVETTPMASSSLSSFTTASSYGGAHAPSTKTYPFDKVFGPEADQTMVFKEVAEGMLDEVLAGYNCTIFAYGQTGTGKTYTMQGDLDLSPLSAPKSEAGIVPRVLHRLFSLLESAVNTEYTVRCSYVELYNEELRDLLSAEYNPVAAGDKQPMAMAGNSHGQQVGGLKLYEDGKKGVMIQGLEETGVRTLQEALGIVNKGCMRRQVAETKMNTESSRSHTIFSITVHVKETSLANGGDDLLRIGKFNLVDLAGSEAIGRSGATDKRAREAGMINQSLLTLGRVISALTEKSSHIPYRESKLTRLLQDSLGGRTKTCIVATVSPTRSNMEETLSTLDYAIRAKSIRNRPEVNAHLTKSGVLKEYLGDIERLKAEVMAAREKNGIYVPEESWREMHEAQTKLKSDYDEAKLRANAASVELETKRKEFDQLSSQFLITTEELKEAREAERVLGEMIERAKEELDVVKVRLAEESVVSKAYERGERRLAGVAEGLRGVAVESVADVGGLFEKIARKAKVLGDNADAATTFGNDMGNLSLELRAGLDKLASVQSRFGEELRSGLDAYAKHSQKHSKKDLDRLETSFSSFNDLAQTLTVSLESGKADAATTGQELMVVKAEVLDAVRRYTDDMANKSAELMKEVKESQAEQMTTISSVLGSTADLVDAVISTARGHLEEQRKSAEESRAAAQRATGSEIARLRSQNALLVKLLQEEKTKTSTLRSQLINNLTELIVGFTDAQEASLSTALTSVQSGNEQGILEMQAYGTQAEDAFVRTEEGVKGMVDELDMGQATGLKQREAGEEVVRVTKEGLGESMDEYGEKVGGEVREFRRGMEAVCERFENVAGSASERADERAVEQVDKLAQLSISTKNAYEGSKSRLTKDQDSVVNLTESLVQSNASTSKSYSKHHTSTTGRLDAICASTAQFLQKGINEDVPTGVTPRKKAYNVKMDWERVQPRDRLVQAYRERKAAGLPLENGELEGEAEEEEEVGGLPLHVNMNEVESGGVDGAGSGASSGRTTPQESAAEVRTSASTASLQSLGSAGAGAEAAHLPTLSRQTSGIPSLSTSTSQMKHKLAGKGMDGGGTRRERNHAAPLGESGLNVPIQGAGVVGGRRTVSGTGGRK